MRAVLTGDPSAPVLELEQFGFNARTPDGRLLREAVKDLPGARWNGKAKQWVVTGTGLGTDPYEVMEAHGFEIDDSVMGEDAWADVDDLADLTVPSVEIERADGVPVEVLVYPRLASFAQVRDHIGESAVPDKKLNCFRLPLPDALDADLQAIPALARRLTGEDLTFAQSLYNEPDTPAAAHEDVDAAAAWLGAETCTDPYDENDPDWKPVLSEEAREKIDLIASYTGRLPENFGLDLFPFQLGGAYAVAAGHNVLVDPPGLGKTRQTLAAAAIRGDKRILLVCPKLAVNNWVRESSGAFGAPAGGGAALLDTKGVAWGGSLHRLSDKAKTKPAETFVPIHPTRAVPALPEEGVVVIAHSTLAARPELTEELISWAPTFVGWDEAHLISNWETKAALSSRMIATALHGRAMCVPITGTPVRSSVVELANLLYFAGHLQSLYDGPAAFLDTYAKRNHFGAWVTKKRPTGLLESLHAKLAEYSWVRRDKTAVLPQLPSKLRAVQVVTTSNKRFKDAHDDLFAKIEEWIDELGHEPNDTEIDEYAATNIGMVTPLRVAAGAAKAEIVAEIVKDWMETHDQPADGPYDDPLLLWFVYTDVMYEVGSKVEELGYKVAYIDGQTSTDDRGGAQELMQAGEIGVLLSTIKAGGQNFTLTRCRQAFMIETDWVPANVTQAEDRIHRISQTRQSTITTLLNPETLDPVVRAVQLRKAEILEKVMPGGDHRVGGFNTMIGADGSVTQITEQELTTMEAVASPADILARIVEDVVASRARRTHGR